MVVCRVRFKCVKQGIDVWGQALLVDIAHDVAHALCSLKYANGACLSISRLVVHYGNLHTSVFTHCCPCHVSHHVT